MNAANNIKKKLSGLSIVSMICAIVFSIAAACMVFLPVISPDTSTEIGQKAADEMSAEIRTGNFFFLNRKKAITRAITTTTPKNADGIRSSMSLSMVSTPPNRQRIKKNKARSMP